MIDETADLTSTPRVSMRGRKRPARPAWSAVSASAAGPTSAAVSASAVRALLREPGQELAPADLAAAAGIRSVEIIAWRDLGHPEAGGSELHSARIAERWAAAGIDVRIVASRAQGAQRRANRDGYQVARPAGRYSIFPAAMMRRLVAAGTGSARPDATVEIWNGMPFLSPLWAPQPRVVLLHHVHDRMWDTVLPAPLAAAGRLLETKIAPPLYRRTRLVTLSQSSKLDIVRRLRLDESRVDVVPPGVDREFVPGERSEHPLVVAVGRLVPYKRFDKLIDVLVELKHRHPRLTAVIAGEGFERTRLERLVASRDAGSWLDLPGRVDFPTLLRLYQSAWVLASSSAFEGWGLTISEAAACATPSVASPIAGHFDAVEEAKTGFLAEPGPAMLERLDLVLRDAALRGQMQAAALAKAHTLSWDGAAGAILRILAEEATLYR